MRLLLPPPPPLEIISDLGLIRPIHTPNQLATLVIREIEEILWHDRMMEQPQQPPSTTTTTHHNPHASIYILRTAPSGLITIVTPNRIAFLRNAGRLPCRHTMCTKWCKGEKGLWWHEQCEHGVEHSSAMVMAASCFGGGGNDDLAMVVFRETQQQGKTSGNTNDSVGVKGIGSGLGDAGTVLIAANTIGNQSYNPPLRNSCKNTIKLPCAPLRGPSLNDAYFQIVKEGNVDTFRHFIQTEQTLPNDATTFSTATNKNSNNGNTNKIHPRSYLDKNGASALHWAAGCGHLPLVQHLINNINDNDNNNNDNDNENDNNEYYHCSSDQPQLGKRSFLIENCINMLIINVSISMLKRMGV